MKPLTPPRRHSTISLEPSVRLVTDDVSSRLKITLLTLRDPLLPATTGSYRGAWQDLLPPLPPSCNYLLG
jgi:hypothetical protein